MLTVAKSATEPHWPRVPWCGAAAAATLLAYGVLLRVTPSFALPYAPPGHAEFLAPAAGVALAAAATWGWVFVPLLLLAACGALGFGWDEPALMTLFATGVQGSIGAWLLGRPARQGELRLETAREILRRLVLPAAAAALLAALPLAWRAGASSPTAAIACAVRVGADFGGMLLAAPIAWSLIGRPREPWAERRLTIGAPLGIVIVLLVAALSTIEHWDVKHARASFNQQAHIAFGHIESQLALAEDSVSALHGTMLMTQGQSTRAQFDAAAMPWLAKSAGVLTLGWHVRVPRPDIEQYQAGVARSGETDFRVRNRPNGVPAEVLAQDADVVVMRHGAILTPNAARRSSTLGINVLSIPEARSTVLRALGGGPVRATPAFRLTGLASQGLGVTLYRGVRLADGSTAGLVFAAVYLEQTLNPARQGLASDLSLCVIDQEEDATERRLAGAPGCENRLATADGLHREEVIEFAGRRWLLRAEQPLSQTLRAAGLANVWLFAAPSLLGASLLSVLLLLTTGRAQRESRERERAERGAAGIFETATVGLVQVTPDQRISNVNRAYCELTGYSRGELLTMRLADLTPADDQALDAQAWQALSSGATDTVNRGRKHYLRKDGSLVPVSVQVRAVRDAGGELLHTVGAVQDITETLRLQEAEREREVAKAANLAKSEFVARISHELRTPLNAILGFAQLLDARAAAEGQSDTRTWLRNIQQAGWHLLAMINDLLDLSRLESGSLSVEAKALELREIVETCLAMVAEPAARKSIVVRCDLAADALRAEGDPVRVRQVLINLMSNAVKYNREGGRLTVCSRRLSDTQLAIEVTDTGLGLSPDQLETLFQPFNRLGRERSGVEGTGIGLVIAKRLAELMGGTLGARSTAGQGSTFTLVLPAVTTAPGQPGVATRAEVQPRDTPAPWRVLYIEDNETNVEIVRAMLARRSDIRLDAVATGQAGLEQAWRAPPQLVLLDLGLPDFGGLEVLRRLRADRRTAKIPVIVVSAEALGQSIDHAMRAGATHYLTKPLSLASLMTLVDAHLGAELLAQ